MHIDYDLIIGNIILSLNKQTILKSEIYSCLELLDKLLPDNYYLYGNYNIDIFLDYYSFLFEDLGDKIRITKNKEILERYFKIGIPKQIIELCNMSVLQLNNNNNKVLIK